MKSPSAPASSSSPDLASSTTSTLKSIFKKNSLNSSNSGNFSSPSHSTKTAFPNPEKDALLQLIKSSSSDHQSSEAKKEVDSFPSELCDDAKSPQKESTSPVPLSEVEEEFNIFFLDKENKHLQLRTPIEFTPISQFTPSPKDVIHSVCVDASSQFIYYLLKDGKVRLISKTSGKRELLRGERTPFIDFSLASGHKNTPDRLALLGKGGNVEIYEIDVQNATGADSGEYIELEKICRVLFQPAEQPFFSQITWHPTDKSILIAHAHQRREVYFICTDELEEQRDLNEVEAAANECSTTFLSILPNGALSQAKGIYKLTAAKCGEDSINNVSFSPSGSYIAKIGPNSVCISASSNTEVNICQYHVRNVHRVFWICSSCTNEQQQEEQQQREEALLLCCDSQICVAEFNPSKFGGGGGNECISEQNCFSFYSFQFAKEQPTSQIKIKNHYSWDPVYRILFVGNEIRNSIVCVAALRDEDSQVRGKRSIFWKVALLGEYRISHSISCMRLILDRTNETKRFLCTVYNSGVCSYAIDINSLFEDAAKLRLGAAGPHLKTSRKPSTVSLLGTSSNVASNYHAHEMTIHPHVASNAAFFTSTEAMRNDSSSSGIVEAISSSLHRSIQGEFAEMFIKLEADYKMRETVEKERHEQVLKSLASTLSKNLPSLVEYAVKSQLESIVVTKLSSVIKTIVQEALSKQQQQLNSSQSSNDNRMTEEIQSSLSAIKDSLGKIVQVLEASIEEASGNSSSTDEESGSIAGRRSSCSSNDDESTSAAGSGKKVSSIASAPPITIQQELEALVQANRVEDAFRRALNVKNIGILIFLLKKFNPETFFTEIVASSNAGGSVGGMNFSTSNLLSLCQQLTIELQNESELKLAWLQEALLTIDTADASVRQYFGHIYPFVSSHLQQFIENGASAVDTSCQSNVKLAKILLKLANSIMKNIPKSSSSNGGAA